MSFIFLLNLQRALLSQTFWCFVGIFNCGNAAYYRAIFRENCNLTLKLGQDSSQAEAAWPELPPRFLTGTHFLSDWLREGGLRGCSVSQLRWSFHLPDNSLRTSLSKRSDTAVRLLETLHLISAGSECLPWWFRGALK